MRIKAIIPTLLALALGVCAATAQTGSSKSTTVLNTEVNSLFPDQNAGAITPFNARQTLLDIIASNGNISSGGIDQNILNSQTNNYTIALTDCGKIIQAGTGSSGQFTITLPSTSGFAANCSVLIKNNDAGRGKLLSGFPSDAPTVLWPQQAIGVKIVNGGWATFYSPGRYRLAAAATFFADQSSGSDSNDCLASGSGACATLQHLWDLVADNIDCNGQAITLSAASATWTAGIATDKQPVGCAGPQSVTLNGNGGTIAETTGNALTFGSNKTSAAQWSGISQVTLTNFTLKSTVASGLAAYGGGTQIAIGAGMGCGAVNQTCITAGHQTFIGATLNTAFTLSADNAGAHPAFYAYSGSYIAFENVGPGGPIVTCSGALSFQSFVSSTENATINFAGATFSGCGSVTGLRFAVTQRGSIVTGSGLTFFPGNAAGTLSAGGGYDGLASTQQIIFLSNGGVALPQNTTGFQVTANATTEVNVTTLCPRSGTFLNLYVHSTAPAAGQTLTNTVRINGVDSSLTCTITGTGTTCNDTTHSVSCVAGDSFSLKTVTSATTGSLASVQAGVEFDSP